MSLRKLAKLTVIVGNAPVGHANVDVVSAEIVQHVIVSDGLHPDCRQFRKLSEILGFSESAWLFTKHSLRKFFEGWEGVVAVGHTEPIVRKASVQSGVAQAATGKKVKLADAECVVKGDSGGPT